MMATDSPSPATELVRAAKEITDLLESVFANMQEVVDHVIGVHRDVVARGDLFTCEDLLLVRPLILQQLQSRSFIDGLGVLTSSHLLTQHSRHIEWWRRDGSALAPLVLNFDPGSVDIYDYLEMEWFVKAQSENCRSVFGPYVDYAGADHYVLTMAAPIVDDEFLGIVGADVRMDFFEPELFFVLQELDEPAVLVNAERRVVAATFHDVTVGAKVSSMPHEGERGVAATVAVGADSEWVLALYDVNESDADEVEGSNE